MTSQSRAEDFYYNGERLFSDQTPFDDHIDNISKVMIVNMKNNIVGSNQLNYKKAGFYTLRDLINQRLKVERQLIKKFDVFSYSNKDEIPADAGVVRAKFSKKNVEETTSNKEPPNILEKNHKKDYGKLEFKNRLYKGKILLNYQYGFFSIRNDVNLIRKKDQYSGEFLFDYKNSYFSIENKLCLVNRRKMVTSLTAKPLKIDSYEIQPHFEYHLDANYIKSEVSTKITPELLFVYSNEQYLKENSKINSYNFRYNIGF